MPTTTQLNRRSARRISNSMLRIQIRRDVSSISQHITAENRAQNITEVGDIAEVATPSDPLKKALQGWHPFCLWHL
jgi:hypothetical protein